MKIRFTKSDYAAIAAMLVYSASATVTPVCLLKMADELHFSLSASGGIEGMRLVEELECLQASPDVLT